MKAPTQFCCPHIFRIPIAASLTLPLLVGTTARAQTYTLTTLTTFNYTNGDSPGGNLIFDGSGNLYGTAAFGGQGGDGTVFKIAAGTNTLTTIASFNGANGAVPNGLTLDSAGNIYGAATQGGANSDGTIFKIAAGTNVMTTLATFNNTNGNDPNSNLVIDSSGNLYGVTAKGGANNDGTVFEIAANTNALTTLATFNGSNGKLPEGITLDNSGNLYGTTEQGGASSVGTVFKIAAGTSTLTTLATFTGTATGQYPSAGVTLDSNGNLYGITATGGTSNDGTVFKVATGANTITTLATFTGTANGANPYSGVVLDSEGNLYGTTNNGGANSDGTVFKVAAGTNALTALATFNGTNGAYPFASLTLDSNGNLYGTTSGGGANSDGTVFKLTPSGASSAPEPGTLFLLLPALAPALYPRVRRRRCAVRL